MNSQLKAALRGDEHAEQGENGDNEGSKKKDKKKKGEREKVLSFVSLTFRGTRHQTVGDSHTTLLLSLQHPHSDVRCAAIKTVQNLLQDEQKDTEVR